MKKALLPALITVMMATSAHASSRALLFGPAQDAAKAGSAESSASATANAAPSKAAKAEPGASSATARPNAAAGAVASDIPLPSLEKAGKSPAKAVARSVKHNAEGASMKPTSMKQAAAPVMKPVFLSSSGPGLNDPMSQRKRLEDTLKEEVSVGFFPSATGNNDSFSFMLNYLPLSNLLSTESGVLVNFVPERDLSKYRKKIAQSSYPYIFINAALADEALSAGYKPVAVGVEKLAAGYLVLADSKLKTVEDIKNAKVAWSRNAQITMLAMAELTQKGSNASNTYLDVGGAGRVAAVEAVNSGASDVAILRSTEVDKLVSENPTKYRSLGASAALPASGLWVRQDLLNHSLTNRISRSLLTVSPDAEGLSKAASTGFSRGFGVVGKFERAAQDTSSFTNLIDSAKKGFPSYFTKIEVDAKARDGNLATSVPVKRTIKNEHPSVAERMGMLAKFGSGMKMGVFAPGTAHDSFAFQANALSLSNFISETVGNAVTMIPESNQNNFAQRIADNVYPAIIISPLLTSAALMNGYYPVARGGEFVTAALLVPGKSNISTFADLKSRRVATVRESAPGVVGKWEIANSEIKDVKFSYIGSFADGTSVLNSGAVDAVMMGEKLAKSIVDKAKDKDGNPIYKAVSGVYEVPSSSLWIRQDLYEDPMMVKLGETFKTFSPAGDGLMKRAFLGYARMTGFVEPWQQSGIEEHTIAVQMIDLLQKSNDSPVSAPKEDIALMEANRMKPVLYPLNINTKARAPQQKIGSK